MKQEWRTFDGKQVIVEIQIDHTEVARSLVSRALKNKTGVAMALRGAVKVKAKIVEKAQ
jgi:hypothetical protein